MKKIILFLGIFFLIVCTAHASPVTIDFDTVPIGSGIQGETVDIGGVLFDGWIMGLGFAAGAGMTQPTITFSHGPADLIGFTYLSLGDAQCLIDGSSELLPFGFGSFVPSTDELVGTISFTLPTLGAIVLDNLYYEYPTAQTPIPGPLALLGIALAGFFGTRKKSGG
ncbi:hypothetical protein [Desulfoplanes sp.]